MYVGAYVRVHLEVIAMGADFLICTRARLGEGEKGWEKGRGDGRRGEGMGEGEREGEEGR